MRSPTSHRLSQRGFSLIEVMTASVVLSIFVIAMGAMWIRADSSANDLVVRQKAIFVANAEMERITALYNRTSFGALGPDSTTGYTELASFPATRLIYPTSLSAYLGSSGNYITTAANSFQSGNEFQVWVNSELVPSLNRSYVWIDRDQNVMGRLSWKATNITAASCVVGSSCACLSYFGTTLFAGSCQRLELYLEYPYRLVSGAAVAGTNLQSVTLTTIVGRQT